MPRPNDVFFFFPPPSLTESLLKIIRGSEVPSFPLVLSVVSKGLPFSFSFREWDSTECPRVPLYCWLDMREPVLYLTLVSLALPPSFPLSFSPLPALLLPPLSFFSLLT